jgi:hypothetical protein
MYISGIMFLKQTTLYGCLLAALAFTGCKKERDETAVTYGNNTPEAITLNIYPNMNAYASSDNITYTTQVPRLDQVVIPGKTFAQGLTYYAEWYSADFLYNNWFNDKYPGGAGRVAITPKVGANSYIASGSDKNYNRLVFLNGDSVTSTKWVAVDAYQYSVVTGYVSVWYGLQNWERKQEIIVRKNFTSSYSYKDQYGNDKEMDMEFKVLNAPHSFIEFYDGDNSNLGSMSGGILPTAPAPDYVSNSVDTIMGLLPGSELRFMMVKQR